MKSPRRPMAGSTGAVVRLAGSTITSNIPITSTVPAASLQRQRGAEHLHACGARAVGEFLDWLGKRYCLEQEIAAELAEWRTLPPDLVQEVLAACCGGREFPPTLTVMPDAEDEQADGGNQ